MLQFRHALKVQDDPVAWCTAFVTSSIELLINVTIELSHLFHVIFSRTFEMTRRLCACDSAELCSSSRRIHWTCVCAAVKFRNPSAVDEAFVVTLVANNY